MKKQTKVNLAFLAIILSMAVAAFLSWNKDNQIRQRAFDRKLAAHYTIENWKTNSFISVTNRPAVNELVRRHLIHLNGTATLTSSQHESLVTSINHFLDAYTYGGFSNFLRFRSPTPHNISKDFCRVTREIWLKDPPITYYIATTNTAPGLDSNYTFVQTPPKGLDISKLTDAELILAAYRQNATAGVLDSQSIIPFEGRIRYISDTQFDISIYEINSVPQPLNEWVLDTFPTGDGQLGCKTPMASYLPAYSPERIVQDHGNLTLVIITFLIRFDDTEPIAPVYLRYFWDPQASVWVPESIVVANLYRRNLYTLFF